MRVLNQFIEPMTAAGFSFYGGDLNAARSRVEAYEERLNDISDEIFQLAVDYYIEHRKQKSFPTIAEIKTLCAQLKSRQSVSGNSGRYQTYLDGQKQEALAWSKARKIYARQRLIDCEYGKVAAKEGWIDHLFRHYRYANAVPTKTQVETMRSKGRTASALLQKHRNNPHWKKMIRVLLERRKQLENLVLHGEIIPDN